MSISLNGDGIISGVTTLTTTPLDVITLDVTEINVGTGASVFSPAANTLALGTNGSERVRVLAAGGLTFNGDTATANALDDYEEGTWTPTLGGNATYNNQYAEYTKIGRLVNIRMTLIVNSIGTGSNTTISGLPFTAYNTSSQGNTRGSVGYFANIAVSTVSLLYNITMNSSTMDFITVATSGTTSNGSGAIFGNSAHIQVNATYMATS